jgi:long-chain acyl-CoA synthetase
MPMKSEDRGSGVAAAAHEPGSFGRAAAWLSKQVELALTGVDLSLPQYRVLGLLAEGVSIPSALADRLTVRRPTVTAVVDGLEIRGLVQRTPGDHDKRRVTHTLTTKGQRLLAKANVAVDARLTDIAGSLDDPALTDQALDSLVLWRSAMRAYHSAPETRA